MRQQDRIKGKEGELGARQHENQDKQSPKSQVIQTAKPPPIPAAEGVAKVTLHMDFPAG